MQQQSEMMQMMMMFMMGGARGSFKKSGDNDKNSGKEGEYMGCPLISKL